jgi:chorismate dehydratase
LNLSLPQIFPEISEVFIKPKLSVLFMNNIHQINDEKNNELKIGRISYINVDPVYYQLDHAPIPDGIQVISRPPAVLNQMLLINELDISSVSSSAFARHSDQWMILPDLSISCYGKVLSVLLVSHYSFEELQEKTVLLTDESATAVDLVKLILSLKGISPVFQKGKVKSPEDLTDFTGAGLVIGDAALRHQWKNNFEHVWDLCEIWNQMTGLPFVFGVWAVRKSYAHKYPQRVSMILEMFKKSKKEGLRNISDIARQSAEKIGIDPDLSARYFNSMYYNMSAPELECLKVFFDRLYSEKIINKKPELIFFDPVKKSSMRISI